MSEPVSKAEIEDVLSSIRRLVSENTGAVRRDAANLQAAEKLVLTPAFRVDEDESATPDEEEADQAVGAVVVDAETPSPEAAVAQVVEAQAEPVETATEPEASAEPLPGESDIGDVQPVGEQPVETSEFDEAEGQAEMPDQPEAEAAPADDPAEGATEVSAPRPVSPLEQRIAELEAVVAQSAAEFEPDGSEVEARPDEFMFYRHSAAVTEPVPDSEPEIAQPSEPTVDEAEPVLEPERAAPVSEEAAAARLDVATEGEPTAEADAWEDVAASPAAAPEAAESAGDWEDEAPEQNTESDSDTDAVIDEDALRELVARMVREELQGSVGERITHNVRRMVRREISRALSLQEFE